MDTLHDGKNCQKKIEGVEAQFLVFVVLFLPLQMFFFFFFFASDSNEEALLSLHLFDGGPIRF